MQTFLDNAGRTWTVSINVDAIKRVRDLAKVNLMEAVEGELLERFLSDPILLCDVLYCLCKPAADALGVTDEHFGQAMAGDAIEGATTALLEELVGFFPSRRRAVLAKAVAKLRSLEQMVLTAANQRLDSPQVEQAMQAAMAQVDARIEQQVQAALDAQKSTGG